MKRQEFPIAVMYMLPGNNSGGYIKRGNQSLYRRLYLGYNN